MVSGIYLPPGAGQTAISILDEQSQLGRRSQEGWGPFRTSKPNLAHEFISSTSLDYDLWSAAGRLFQGVRHGVSDLF
jgi:hypothetical protein